MFEETLWQPEKLQPYRCCDLDLTVQRGYAKHYAQIVPQFQISILNPSHAEEEWRHRRRPTI